MTENGRTIEQANSVVSDYAEKKMLQATRIVDILLKGGRGIDPQEVALVLEDYKTWFGFVRGVKEIPPDYRIIVIDGKAVLMPPNEE